MTIQEIESFIQENLITYKSLKVEFKDNTYKFGFFDDTIGDRATLKVKNQWRFIENNNAVAHKQDKSNTDYITILDGNQILKIIA